MKKKRILVIAPHPDDETIAVGGTMVKFISQGCDVHVLTVSGHLPPLYDSDVYEKTILEASNAYKILEVTTSNYLKIPATMIGDLPVNKLNGLISKEIDSIKPQIVLCPFPDRHIDHRLVFESVMVATRPIGLGNKIEIVAAYETLSETHWNAPHIEPNFTPNWVVDITNQIDKKLEALKCYKSQVQEFPGPRSVEAVEALAKFRGTQAGFAYGEGFHIIRMIN